jgi:hypothetical protein
MSRLEFLSLAVITEHDVAEVTNFAGSDGTTKALGIE